jgi:MSHA biogenesis protein MshK
MDEAVMKLRALGMAATLLCAAQVLAQGLPDPTRPPPLLSSGHGAAGAPGPSGPLLQSVLIARQPGGRHVAVIDGETVRLGDTWKGARVVRMTQTEVELVRGRERQVLKLYAPEAGIVAGSAVQR